MTETPFECLVEKRTAPCALPHCSERALQLTIRTAQVLHLIVAVASRDCLLRIRLKYNASALGLVRRRSIAPIEATICRLEGYLKRT